MSQVSPAARTAVLVAPVLHDCGPLCIAELFGLVAVLKRWQHVHGSLSTWCCDLQQHFVWCDNLLYGECATSFCGPDKAGSTVSCNGKHTFKHCTTWGRTHLTHCLTWRQRPLLLFCDSRCVEHAIQFLWKWQVEGAGQCVKSAGATCLGSWQCFCRSGRGQLANE